MITRLELRKDFEARGVLVALDEKKKAKLDALPVLVFKQKHVQNKQDWLCFASFSCSHTEMMDKWLKKPILLLNHSFSLT